MDIKLDSASWPACWTWANSMYYDGSSANGLKNKKEWPEINRVLYTNTGGFRYLLLEKFYRDKNYSEVLLLHQGSSIEQQVTAPWGKCQENSNSELESLWQPAHTKARYAFRIYYDIKDEKQDWTG